MAGCVQVSKMFLKLFSYALKDRQQPTNFLFYREWGFLFEKKFKKKFKKKQFKKKFKKKFKKTNLRKNLRSLKEGILEKGEF